MVVTELLNETAAQVVEVVEVVEAAEVVEAVAVDVKVMVVITGVPSDLQVV